MILKVKDLHCCQISNITQVSNLARNWHYKQKQTKIKDSITLIYLVVEILHGIKSFEKIYLNSYISRL